MGDYKLSASLRGHEDDVRSVAFPHPAFALSASRDATVRLWKLKSPSPPEYDYDIKVHGTAFVNSLTYVPPSAKYPEGLVVSAGQDSIIDVRQPGKAPEDNAEALLLGHGHNVCALDVSVDGNFILSGSWDNDARIWPVGKWDISTVLQGHTAAVWAVLSFDKDTVITGCADKIIRVFRINGSLVRSIQTADVVRALCKLPPNHPSGAQFASAGNDAVITLWNTQGRRISQLQGHDSFIYSLAALPDGRIVSAGEDRTARIWNHQQCLQTITHPAISVWSVAVCPDNGDIITGASDRIVRIFSSAPERYADPAAIEAFNDSVKSSSIPQQAVGSINKEKLPGPEFLTQKSGTKEGQVQMINEANGNIAAYQWSSAANQWVNVGTVVDAAGSSGVKSTYDGKDYDFVFDVDIEDGKPPLKLPYNLSQNPYEVAQKFCADNKLPITYLDQVTNFIVQNTQGATIGQSTSQGADPWGTDARYRPGDAQQVAPPTPASRPKLLPQKDYLDILTANHKIIFKKLQEFNQKIIEDGHKELSLNPSDIHVLESTIPLMEKGETKDIDPLGIDIILKTATSWPADKRLPGLDLLRLLAASEEPAKYLSQESQSITQLLPESGVFESSSSPNNTMMAVRTFSNLFRTPSGRKLVDQSFDTLQPLLKPFLGSSNRNLIIALTTLYINYAVLLSKSEHGVNADRALTLLDDLAAIINGAGDAEAVYRALVAAGTILCLGEEYCEAGRDVFGLGAAVTKAEQKVKEPRIKNVVAEIRELLK
jgi:phospholipase A-2-activating protein